MPQQHNDPERSAADESFAEIVAGLGDLASVDGYDGFGTARIELPDPEGRYRPMVMTLEAPPEIAQLIRTESGPQRMVAMVRAMQALSELADPPGR